MTTDVRPPGLNLRFRPGTTITFTITGWPPGSLAGRLFQATLGVDVLDLTINGDVMTIVVDNTITDNYPNSVVTFLLNEQIVSTYEPIIIGRWTPSLNARETVSASQAFQVVIGAVEVTINVAHDDAKVARTGDTMTGGLVLSGTPTPLTISDIHLTAETHSGVKHLLVDGVYHNFHPVIFRSHVGSSHDGTLSGPASGGLTNGIPRITLAKPGTKTIKWVEEVPAGWDNIAISMYWCKEAAGSGNVHWRISYQVLSFLSGTDDIDSGTMTQVYNANVAVPATAGLGVYTITSAPFATAPQIFAIPPVVSLALQRIDDAGDTYAGAVSVGFTSMSFV